MKFLVTKSNDAKYKKYINLYTLEDLLNFCNSNGGQLILKNIQFESISEIEIYQ